MLCDISYNMIRSRSGVQGRSRGRAKLEPVISYTEILLPQAADNRLRGSKLPLYLFILTAFVSTVRSLIHLLAPDGGAGSIAGMDLSVQGANGIIFAFSLWGSGGVPLPVARAAHESNGRKGKRSG